MERTYMIGEKNGIPVVATYEREDTGSACHLVIRCGDELILDCQGSAIEPEGAAGTPNITDVLTWQGIAGLPLSVAQARAAIMEHDGLTTMEHDGLATRYLAISVTPMYAPADDLQEIMSVHESRAKAEAAVRDYRPDWDDQVGCVRCEQHGQSGGRYGQVAHAVQLDIDDVTDDEDVWAALPDDVQGAIILDHYGETPTSLLERWIDPEQGDTLEDALNNCGYKVLWYAQDNTYWLIRPTVGDERDGGNETNLPRCV